MQLTYGELFEYTYTKLNEDKKYKEKKYNKNNIKPAESKYIKNKEILKYLDNNPEISKKSGWEKIKNTKYIDLLKYFFNSKEFEKSILEGYEQATEVLNVLKSQHTVLIYEKDSDTVMWKVDTTQFKELHIVIVTQERYSLIQNNPSLLLAQDIEVVPSCFCIDDLETILLTFSRMCNPIKDFCEYLSVKEKLSSRLIYEDELDLAGKFLLERSSVIQCLQDNHLYTIDNSYSNFFDIMYNQFSLGFEKELNTLGKLHVSEQGIEMYKECKRIGLKFWPEMEKFCESILNEQSKTKVEEFD